MLMKYTAISSLTEDQRKRLTQAANLLVQTNEAAQGFIMFEGLYLQTAEVKKLVKGPLTRIILG